MPRRAPACKRLPVRVREHRCVRLHAPSHWRARTLAARGREYAGSSPPAAAQRRGVLGIVRSTPMEGVCALRHGRSTFRRPGTKRARVQHPLEYPCPVPVECAASQYPSSIPARKQVPSTLRTLPAPPCSGPAPWGNRLYPSAVSPRVLVLCEFPGRTGGCAEISARTSSTARSPPRCRSSSC
jgi:hypothetical protein